MRIIHLLSQTEITGAEVYAVTLAEWQQAQGHDVEIISDTLNTKTDIKYTARPIHPKNFWLRLKNIFFLRKKLKQSQTQVLHCHSRAAARVAYWARLGLPVFYISTVHGRQHLSWSKKIWNLYGSSIIAVCENIRKHLIDELKLPDFKIQVIGNPIDTKHLIFRQNMPPKRSLAVVGRTSGPKGEMTEKLIAEVFPKLFAEYSDLEIYIVGGPIERLSPEIQKLIPELNSKYADRLKTPGYVTGLESKLKDFQCVISAGRIAMSSLIQGIPTYAMGEYGSVGWVNLETFSQAKESNFGDIGPSLKNPLDTEKIHEDISSFFKNTFLFSEQKRQALSDLARGDFASHNVFPQIMSLYQWGYFKIRIPQHIPILMYHKITNRELQTPHRIFVTKDTFERHLKFFKFRGFQTLSFADLNDFLLEKKDYDYFPDKPLILTFDDGYQNNLTYGVPLLKKYGFQATLFLLANSEIATNIWDKGTAPQLPLMTAKERQEIFNSGVFELGSHGFEHRRITDMDEKSAFLELSQSKSSLEQEFSRPVLAYAFTYGSTKVAYEKLAQKAGYTFAVNTDSGGLHMADNPMSIFRTPIFPEDTYKQLWKKTSAWYRWYFYFKRRK